MSYNRPDIPNLRVGELYRESLGGFVVEFMGTGCMPELNGEDVAVFRFVDDEGMLIATRRDYDGGQTFQPIENEITDDLDDL